MQPFPLGNFYANTQAVGNQNPTPMRSVDFSTFSPDHFFTVMTGIDSMSENDIINIIKNYIDIIVNITLNNDKKMGPILSHPKFVEAYYKVMTQIPLDTERRLFVNKLTYDYSITENQNPEILKRFRDISEFANKPEVGKLTRLGLNYPTANNLVLCRFSSSHENVNVQRLNFAMCKYDPDVFTEQMIIWVYEQLFDRIGDLFTYSMLEVYEDQELNELGEDFRDVYGNISLSILTILNNMPSKDIRTVILRYMQSYVEWYKKRQTLPRFTLRALSYDYERIVNIVDKLLLEGYDVP